MAFFNIKALKLEQAFCSLCSKLYLKGETQQIDRILYQLSLRYFECNPHCIFGTRGKVFYYIGTFGIQWVTNSISFSTDVVHAIVYSLLLLNIDLHVAQSDYKKMSQSAFVKNTMNAISAQLNGTTNEWVLPLQRTPSNKSDFFIRSSTYAQSLNASMPLSWKFGSKSWQIDIKDLLKQMYTNIRNNQLLLLLRLFAIVVFPLLLERVSTLSTGNTAKTTLKLHLLLLLMLPQSCKIKPLLLTFKTLNCLVLILATHISTRKVS